MRHSSSPAQALGLQHGLPAHVVFERAVRASDQKGYAQRAIAFHLEEIHSRSLCNASPYSDVEHFALCQLHMEPRRCREAIQVGRLLRHLTAVDDAFLAGDISWSKVVRMLPVVQLQTQVAWVEFAKTATYAQLKFAAKSCKPGQLPGEGSDYGIAAARNKIVHMLTDPQSAMYEQVRACLSVDRKEPVTDDQVLDALLVRFLEGRDLELLDEDAVHPEEREMRNRMLPYDERNHEEVPEQLRLEILARDNYQCCNCKRRHDLHVHHIVDRSVAGSNDPRNLITLCRSCHTSVHTGYLIVVVHPNRKPTFTDGAGNPLDRVRGGRPPEMFELHLGSPPGQHTAEPLALRLPAPSPSESVAP